MAGIVGQPKEPQVGRDDKDPMIFQVDDLAGVNLINRASRNLSGLLAAWQDNGDHGSHEDRTYNG